jgi:t-SNARE complex subunit (syntaxin)
VGWRTFPREFKRAQNFGIGSKFKETVPVMSEFEQARADALHVADTLRAKISTLSNIASDKRTSLVAEIENLFRELTEQLDSINKQRIMWDSSENAQATRFIQEMNATARQLGDQFSHERGRSELFAGAITKSNLAGGSTSQRESLVTQRQTIDKGSELLQSVGQGLSDITGAGQSVLMELGRQREKENQIGGRLEDLDSEVTDGNRTIGRMAWREKKKTIAIWVVVILVIIGLGVFLYFVFK